MGKDVFANGMEIAHRAGDGKVTAAFPDVCLSPPPPPTGPVPVPYPNTSFAKDLKRGSTTVKIGGKPLALAGKSFYKTVPLGDEAATRNFGGSVITHTITGKTYFQAHSMNVTAEGEAVCRHVDITTSNHASYPGSTAPFPNVEASARAKRMSMRGKCACCRGDRHGDGEAMHRDEWYEANIRARSDRAITRKEDAISQYKDKLTAAKRTGDGAAIKRVQTEIRNLEREIAQTRKLRWDALQNLADLSRRADAPKKCLCPPVAPSPPCDVFYMLPVSKKKRDEQHKKIDGAWKNFKRAQLGKPPSQRIAPLKDMRDGNQVNHLTPKDAGGCPVGAGNLTLDRNLCYDCKKIELGFTKLQAIK